VGAKEFRYIYMFAFYISIEIFLYSRGFSK